MSRAVGRVVEVVASPFVAAGRAVGSVVGGVLRGGGALLSGIGEAFTAKSFGGAWDALSGGVSKAFGETVGGVLGAGKELFGNPVTAFLTGGALMMGTGGLAGFALAGGASALFGGSTSEMFGSMQQGIYNWTGVTQPEAQGHKCNNECKLGPKNGQVCENPGINYPPGMPPQFYPQDPNFVGPPVPPGYCPPNYGQQQQNPMNNMIPLMMMMSTMAMMMPMMSSMGGGGNFFGGNMGSGLDAYFAGGQFNALPGQYGPGCSHRFY